MSKIDRNVYCIWYVLMQTENFHDKYDCVQSETINYFVHCILVFLTLIHSVWLSLSFIQCLEYFDWASCTLILNFRYLIKVKLRLGTSETEKCERKKCEKRNCSYMNKILYHTLYIGIHLVIYNVLSYSTIRLVRSLISPSILPYHSSDEHTHTNINIKFSELSAKDSYFFSNAKKEENRR